MSIGCYLVDQRLIIVWTFSVLSKKKCVETLYHTIPSYLAGSPQFRLFFHRNVVPLLVVVFATVYTSFLNLLCHVESVVITF